jgi:membrane associated rhomboid family serine protease
MRQNAYFSRGSLFGHHLSNSVTNKLVIANIIVHLFKALSSNPMAIIHLFGLSPKLVVTQFFIWQPITYMFLHADFTHLFFNLFMTWMLGNTLESVWGPKKFLKYYISCGLGGAAFSAIFTFSGPPVIGNSGAVFGLYLGYALMFPNAYVYLNFLLPIKAKYLVTFLAAAQLFQGFAGGSGIAYFAHLGGMAAGLLFFKDKIRATRLGSLLRVFKSSGSQPPRQKHWEAQESAKIDSILDKIAAKGFENLSATEKRILENYSRKQKEDSE